MMTRTIIVLAAVITAGCGQDPVVTAAKKQHAEFVGTKPNAVEVVGTYVLTNQTIIPGGILAFAGGTCEIHVDADGTFSVTNYPSGATLGSFFSATGMWEIATVGTSYGYGPNPKDCWGLRFEGTTNSIDPSAFTGPQRPYGLLTIIGDPDSNLTLQFSRRNSTQLEPHGDGLKPAP